MNKNIWGIRTLAEKLGTTRSKIREMITTKKITPKKIIRANTMNYVFDEKTQTIVKDFVNRNKKTS